MSVEVDKNKKRSAEDLSDAPLTKKVSNGTDESEIVHSLKAPWIHLSKCTRNKCTVDHAIDQRRFGCQGFHEAQEARGRLRARQTCSPIRPCRDASVTTATLKLIRARLREEHRVERGENAEEALKWPKPYSHDPFTESEVAYVECPDLYSGTRPTVFLAGGISNCPNWQLIMKDLIKDMCPGLIPSNPRRRNFDVTRSDMHEEQIKWEFDALRSAAVIIFWFPKDTLCPITLYELGTWSVLHKTHGCDIIVGTDPEYGRAADVKTQLSLVAGRDFPVANSLEDLAKALQEWWIEHKA